MPFVFTVNATETNISFEAETVEEGMTIRKSDAMVKALADLGTMEGAESTPPVDNTTVPPAAGKKRGPKPKNQPDPAAAAAPPPAPVPSSQDKLTIPPFLDRTTPPAPPAAPSIVLGPKIKAHIEGLASDDAAKTQWVTWLSSPSVGLVVPNANFDEAMGVLQYTTDAQCSGVAKALGIG